MLLGVDLTAFDEETRKRMGEIWKREDERALIEATARQERIARFYEENQPRAREGMGEMTMAVDPYWRNYFAMQLGTGQCWEAGEFTEWLKKRAPMFGVKAKGEKTQVGWGQHGKTVKRNTGGGGLVVRNDCGGKRWSKSYGEI